MDTNHTRFRNREKERKYKNKEKQRKSANGRERKSAKRRVREQTESGFILKMRGSGEEHAVKGEENIEEWESRGKSLFSWPE